MNNSLFEKFRTRRAPTQGWFGLQVLGFATSFGTADHDAAFPEEWAAHSAYTNRNRICQSLNKLAVNEAMLRQVCSPHNSFGVDILLSGAKCCKLLHHAEGGLNSQQTVMIRLTLQEGRQAQDRQNSNETHVQAETQPAE